MPMTCLLYTSIIEYWEVPNVSPNSHPYTYVWAVSAFMAAYAVYAVTAWIKTVSYTHLDVYKRQGL